MDRSRFAQKGISEEIRLKMSLIKGINCYCASVVEWSITTDCKSVAFGLRRFKSCPAHHVGNVKDSDVASLRPATKSYGFFRSKRNSRFR